MRFGLRGLVGRIGRLLGLIWVYNTPVQELAKILKEMISAEKKKKRSIPSQPPVPAPQRKKTPILGTASSQSSGDF